MLLKFRTTEASVNCRRARGFALDHFPRRGTHWLLLSSTPFFLIDLRTDPSFCHHSQPTSGLDSRAALLVVKILRKIANQGRTVVATIHQPSSSVFEMFVS
jgi:hypothetical protein